MCGASAPPLRHRETRLPAMKARESGMPDEGVWQAFFDADCMIAKLGCAESGDENVVEFGSGYGTFTLPLARRSSGTVHALDIEADLITLLRRKASTSGLANIRAEQRDFVADGSGLPTASVDHAMIWNLLHLERPMGLLEETQRILKPGGRLSIVHWNQDPATPRGPSLPVRPRPEQCQAWAQAAGFAFLCRPDLSTCCPYHYGLLFARADG
jgi:ubiquinone/menaquinone biosynthesis C-methylase UbiE